MIFIKKPNQCPDALQGDKCRQYVADICCRAGKVKVRNRYYSHDSVKDALKEIYHGKCAFCEGKPGATSVPQVEHFRPKSGVKECQQHTGYYWLSHEWSNLLLICPLCNSKKGTKFPLADEATRCLGENLKLNGGLPCSDWTDPHGVLLSGEKRLLLNPEWDDVEQHFYFTPDGEIVGNTKQGKKTIEVYDLNRDKLIEERKNISDRYKWRIESQFEIFLRELKEVGDARQDAYDHAFNQFSKQIINIWDEMCKELDPRQPFFAYRIHMTLLSFDDFIIKNVEEPCGEYIRRINLPDCRNHF